MKDIDTIYAKTVAMSRDIKQLVRFSGYNENDGLNGVKIDWNDPEQKFLRDEMWSVMRNLTDVLDTIAYLSKPFEEVSTLHMNSRGRYETEDETELTCGFPLEALIYDDFYGSRYWVTTRIEHDGMRYYLYGYEKNSLDGLKVRIRKLW